jgi:hypothetical protein
VGSTILSTINNYIQGVVFAHACSGPTSRSSIEEYTGVPVLPSEQGKISGYLSTGIAASMFVANKTTKWAVNDSTDYPFASCAALWRRGFMVAYDGTTWYLISIRGTDDGTQNAHVQFAATTAELGVVIAPEPVAGTPATPQAQVVTINGTDYTVTTYMIDVGDGKGAQQYFKLRDVAQLLSGTSYQFNVGWDSATGSAAITYGAAYTPVGGELALGGGAVQSAVAQSTAIALNGTPAAISGGYCINNNNYFKLRGLLRTIDEAGLGEALIERGGVISIDG